MAGICSKHQGYIKNCNLCNTTPKRIFPDWTKKILKAEAIGTHKCACGFVYYKTIDFCPKCNLKR